MNVQCSRHARLHIQCYTLRPAARSNVLVKLLKIKRQARPRSNRIRNRNCCDAVDVRYYEFQKEINKQSRTRTEKNGTHENFRILIIVVFVLCCLRFWLRCIVNTRMNVTAAAAAATAAVDKQRA